LKAIGYINGKMVKQHQLITSSKATEFRAKCISKKLLANSEDVAILK
jgi:hypothetical protein